MCMKARCLKISWTYKISSSLNCSIYIISRSNNRKIGDKATSRKPNPKSTRSSPTSKPRRNPPTANSPSPKWNPWPKWVKSTTCSKRWSPPSRTHPYIHPYCRPPQEPIQWRRYNQSTLHPKFVGRQGHRGAYWKVAAGPMSQNKRKRRKLNGKRSRSKLRCCNHSRWWRPLRRRRESSDIIYQLSIMSQWKNSQHKQ